MSKILRNKSGILNISNNYLRYFFNLHPVKYGKFLYLHLEHHNFKYIIISHTYLIAYMYKFILCTMYLIKECILLYTYIHMSSNKCIIHNKQRRNSKVCIKNR